MKKRKRRKRRGKCSSKACSTDLVARLTDAAGGGGSVALLRWGEKRRGGRRGQGDGEGEKEEALSRFFVVVFVIFSAGWIVAQRHSETQ